MSALDWRGLFKSTNRYLRQRDSFVRVESFGLGPRCIKLFQQDISEDGHTSEV